MMRILQQKGTGNDDKTTGMGFDMFFLSFLSKTNNIRDLLMCIHTYNHDDCISIVYTLCTM